MEGHRLILDEYQILHELGTGSYGSAHLAFHEPSNTKHVIKKIKISHMTPKELETARREVQVLSSLSHPYITQFQGSCEEDGFLLIAMDYCAGGDLHSLITKRNGILFPEDRVLDWFVQLCLAVKYIHDRKILHRDIKSQNIFLTDDGKVRLGDFGIAKILNSSSELAQTCIGTPYYLSPEMCENKPYNNKSDVWALGCVLYEMITLRHAFEANNMKALILKIIKGTYPPVPPRYSRDLRLLLSQIFQREPQARPSICAVLRKSFIFKRVSKFISGCEEAELKQSLVRRRYHLPPSSHRVVVSRRPSDITEPAAKYGVSLNRKLAHKSPTKTATRAAKQAVPGEKKVPKVSPHIREKLRQDIRKRCPSEDVLSQKEEHRYEVEMSKRYQTRSRSVPHAFKQNSQKPQHQHSKNKTPSPVKLNLMLDSAGLRRQRHGDKIQKNFEKDSVFDSKESYALPRSPAWLADEFLSKKVKATHDKRKHMEAFASGIACGEKPHKDEGAVGRYDSPCKDTVCPVEEAVPLSDIVAMGNKKHKVCNPEAKPRGKLELCNSKDVKELANQSLKWHGSHSEEDDHDEEEALLGVSPEQLRLVMHEKMKEVVKERTKKMSQMVSERRQWAYEKEKLCNTSVSENKEGSITRSNNIASTDASVNGEAHQKIKRLDKLHNVTKDQGDSGIPDNSCLPENEDRHQEAPTLRADDKKPLPVMEDCTSCETKRDDVIRRAADKRKVNALDCQKCVKIINSSPNTIRCELSTQNEEIMSVKNHDTEGNASVDKVLQQEIKKTESSSDSGIRELIPEGSHSDDKEHVASENVVKSCQSTPSLRPRWGAVHTAYLENSPLETTASEMDTTGSSDIVIVYRQAGERKQWGKESDDLISVLSEAQLTEENRKVASGMAEVTKSLMDVEHLSESFLDQQCPLVMMNSTFTLKEGLQDCKGTLCECSSQMHATKIVQKPSLVLNGTFQIDKSSFEKEMKEIGPPLLNSTFDTNVNCDHAITSSETPALNSTYSIDKNEMTVTNTARQKCSEENSRCTNGKGTVILKERGHSLQDTYTISLGANENAQEADSLVVKEEETAITNEKVIPEEISTKTKSGFLEKLRLHMTPQLKYKHQKCDKRFILAKSPLSSKVQGSPVSASSETNIPKALDSTVQIRRGSIKLGFSGILRRFSTKHITKVPTRCRSEETVQKGLESLGDSDVVQSDTDSPEQGVECVTVRFNDGACLQNSNTKITGHVNISKNINNEVSSTTPRLDDKPVVFGHTFDVDSNCTSATLGADDSVVTTRKRSYSINESTCSTGKLNEQFADEPTPSDVLPSNSAFSYIKNLDEMSTDSGIDSQRTSVCQMSSTDCNTSQALCSSSHELQNAKNGSELQKGDSSDQVWLLVSNSSEVTSSSQFTDKQEKCLSSSAKKLTSTWTHNCDVTKTTFVDGNSAEMLQDISPVSTSGIQIKLMTSCQVKEGKVQSKCENDCLDCSRVEQLEHKTQITAENIKSSVKQDYQTVEVKVVTGNEASGSHCRQEDSSHTLNEQPVIPRSPARARPTVLNVGLKTTDILQASQDSISRNDKLRESESSISRAVSKEKLQQQSCSETEESTTAAAQSGVCGNLFAEPTSNSTDVKAKSEELFSSSDEESEDLANLRQSMEFLLNYEGKRREEGKRQLPELWHLDRDGGVVPGGGGVYSWIEEQRAKLEDKLSLDVFKRAYHLLEEAQEREGCVVSESVSQVERLLGPSHCHLAYDILQLVVAEAVYHN